MFTVKHISALGSETLTGAEKVRFDGSAVCFDDDAGNAIYDGIVYVMNWHGSTVARYELHAQKVTAASAGAAAGR